MDLSVIFLGTGGSVPTARRATACLLLRRGGDRLLFDCCEGAQRQMHRSVGLVPVDEIFITHYHADHYLGLPGLLKTYYLQGRERPLRIVGPKGLRSLFRALQRIIGKIGYDLELVEVTAGEALEREGYEVHPFAVSHRVRALGYALIEGERPGRFDAERAAALGIREGPDFGRLQRGEAVEGARGTVSPAEVMGQARAGRRIVITGDTAPCAETLAASRGAQLVVHDGSFAEEEATRAAETGHSTARQAALLAREAKVDMLAIVHVSSRYDVGAVLEEAREIHDNTIAPRDFDLIEVPFPERGEPKLVPNGARERREAPDADPTRAALKE